MKRNLKSMMSMNLQAAIVDIDGQTKQHIMIQRGNTKKDSEFDWTDRLK